MKLCLFIAFLMVGCASRKPPTTPSTYQPAVPQPLLGPTIRDVNDPATEPGSPTSVPVQQLPKASP
jgi:PBP1b-binding outer membrane lipoprotein LpoB